MRRSLTTLAMLALLAGCSSAPDTVAEAPAGDTFPVTVTHRLGETTIPAAPTRVVALGVPDIDVATALGVAPIGATKSIYSADGVWTWDAGALDPAAVTMLDPVQIDIEQIAALRPDLILAHSTASIDTLYPKLAAIAPTVADAHGVLADSWQEETLSIGTALGRRAAAADLVARTEARIGETAAAHPALQGRGYVVGWAREPGAVTVTGNPDDATADLFSGLGLHLADEVAALPRQGGGGRGTGAASVSFEQLGVLDTDVLLIAANSPELGSALEQSPLFTRLAAVEQGRYQSIGLDVVSALRVPTAVNIPWTLDQITPTLGKVLP